MASRLVAEETKARSVSPAPAHLTPLEQITAITEELAKHQTAVDTFAGKKTDKDYLYMEEMMTRLLIKLDRIDSQGKDEIRVARKQAVRNVQAALDHLELKVMANEAPSPPPAPVAGNTDSASATQNHSNQPNNKNNSKPSDPSKVSEMMLDSEMAC